jgi:hypothetical protein
LKVLRYLNSFLDSLPHPRLRCGGRDSPTYRACGVAGFYCAVIAALGGGLLAGRSLLVIALLALVCGLSFYVYAYLRMWIVGREVIVQIEHVWFAFACVALTLWALREPILPYLDVVSAALCFFLVAGRVGCALVGCCHGHPSSLGIIYTEECAREGFPRHLVGVRLFPVPAIEAAGLFAIGVSGLIALPLAQPGKVFAWFLLAYSVMRFGLEGIRGDRRPHFLGLSQTRWMAIIETGLALRLSAGEHKVSVTVVYCSLFAALIAALAYRLQTDRRRQTLDAAHVREVRELARYEIERGALDQIAPVSRMTSRQVTVVISAAGAILPVGAHISISPPNGRGDLHLLCELAARAFPKLIVEATQFTSGRVLHLIAPAPLIDGDTGEEAADRLAQTLYGSVARRLQTDEEMIKRYSNFDQAHFDRARLDHAEPESLVAIAPTTIVSPMPSTVANASRKAPRWFFATGGKDDR